MAEDARLERLYDYTKFHIGLYVTAGGALLAIYASKDSGVLADALKGNSCLVIASIVAMFVAGWAGGVIASSCTVSESFEKLWDGPIGPYSSAPLSGKYWAAIEHTAFWLSAVTIGLAFLL